MKQAPKDKTLAVTRAQLYEAVWSTPLKTLAKKYGISDAALGKICRRLKVPRPGPGYWAKIEAGHKPGRKPLPALSRQQAGMVQVLEQPHPLTRRTEQHFKSIMKRIRDADAQPLVSPPYCDHGRYECTGDEGFPLVVSLAGLECIEASGYLGQSAGALGLRAEARSREKTRSAQGRSSVRVSLARGLYETRIFCRRAKGPAGSRPGASGLGMGRQREVHAEPRRRQWGTRREWTDRSARLEALLPEMLATLVELVPLTKKVRQERLENERIGAEESLRRWKEESRREEEQRQLDNLVKAENELARSEAALRFLDRLDEAFRSSGSVPSAAREWLALARDIATRANPLRAWIEELRRLDTHEPGEAS